MKHYLMVGLSLLGSLNASASEVSGSARLKQAMELQDSGKSEQAYTAALSAIGAIRAKLRVGQVLAKIDTDITEIRNDQVVGKLKTRDEYGGGISALWGLITGGARLAKVSNHDLTKVLVQNPNEVAKFPSRARSELDGLRSQLIQYVNSNVSDIVALKGLGVVYFQASMKLMESGIRVDKGEMQTVIEATSEMSFSGEQNVTACVQTNHSDWRKKDRSDASAEFNLFGLLSANYAEGHQRDERGFAHTETSCKSSTNSVSVSPNDSPVWKIDLSRLDRVVQDWARAAILKRAVSKADDEPFPTFDSPYFRN